MVKSGLVDDPRVSQFRLTAHLGLALAIFAAMFWVGLSLVYPRSRSDRIGVAALGANVGDRRSTTLIFAMALSGGLVAGIRAGFAYNTFPLMNGHLVPPDILVLEPWWRNFFWNMATVQFDHRCDRRCSSLVARAGVVVEAAELRRNSRRARAGADICCSRSSWSRSRLELRRCSSSCRCRSPRCIKRARCSSWRQRSTSRTRCARPASSGAAILRFAVAPMGVRGGS